MKQEIIRKLSAAVAMSLVVGVSLAACGGSSSTAAGVTKTGSAEGFGGAVTATLTVDANGTVTDCKLEGAQETESIGGAALEELSKQVVAANGPAIDGVAGATVTTKAVRKAVAAALGVELAEEAPADSAAAAPAEPAAIVPVEGGIQIGQAYAAAHGTKCFTEAVAVVKDDVILAAYLDDFQFTSTDAGVTAVPNSDSDFAAGYAEGKVLMSKRANADYYSKMMAEKGGSTVALDANFDAIQNFAVGKTISELEDVAAKGAEAVDAVSGAIAARSARPAAAHANHAPQSWKPAQNQRFSRRRARKPSRSSTSPTVGRIYCRPLTCSVTVQSALPQSTRRSARWPGVTPATTVSGGAGRFSASSVSKACSFRSHLSIQLTSQHSAQPLFQAVEPPLDGALRRSKLRCNLARRL